MNLDIDVLNIEYENMDSYPSIINQKYLTNEEPDQAGKLMGLSS